MLKKNLHRMLFHTLLSYDAAQVLRKRILLLSLLFVCCISCSKDDGTTLLDDDSTTTEEPDSTSDPLDLEVTGIRTFGGSLIDTFRSVTATADGGYAVLGTSQSTDGDVPNTTADNQFWVLKYDSNHDLQWTRTYGGSNDDRAEHMIQTQDGGYALAGYSRSNDGDVSGNNGFNDQWLLKTDAAGNPSWDMHYGFAGSDQLLSVVQTADGGYVTAGFLDVTASGGEGDDFRHGVGEFWVHKLDANGQKIWRRYFGGSNNDRAYDVLETPDGGVLLVGSTESNDFDVINPRGAYDFWAIKLGADGIFEWSNNYGGSDIEVAYAATVTQDGNYLLVGDTRSADGDVSNLKGNADLWMVLINPSGTMLWEKTLGGTGFDSARDVMATDQGFMITGASRSNEGDLSGNNGANDVWIVHTDPLGTILWQDHLGGSDIDFAYSLTQLIDGSFIVAGDTESNDQDISLNQGSSDGLLITISQ